MATREQVTYAEQVALRKRALAATNAISAFVRHRTGFSNALMDPVYLRAAEALVRKSTGAKTKGAPIESISLAARWKRAYAATDALSTLVHQQAYALLDLPTLKAAETLVKKFLAVNHPGSIRAAEGLIKIYRYNGSHLRDGSWRSAWPG
jgi:hypothetical protein